MTNSINPSYSFFERTKRFFSPSYRNRQDEKVAEAALWKLNGLAYGFQETDCQKEMKEAQKLVDRISNQRKVNQELKETVKKIKEILVANKIATKQHLPLYQLIDHPEFCKFAAANHLHNKITAQHRATKMGIKFNDDGVPTVTVDNKQLTLDQVKIKFGDHYDAKSGRIAHSEFLADGLEMHDAKQWDQLRPLYNMSRREDQFAHLDPSTGKYELIDGDAIQLISVEPWGWKLQGGSLFGHSWIRFIINGQLYHVGGNLSGNILNPDFMASLPMQGKKLSTSKWYPLDHQQTDLHGRFQTERVIEKLEAIQSYIKTGSFPLCFPYKGEMKAKFREHREQRGGTCSSAATMVFQEATNVQFKRKRGIVSRVIFNPVVTKILDLVYRCLPKSFVNKVIRPIQAATRGAKPWEIVKNEEIHAAN